MWTIFWLIILVFAAYILWDKFGRDAFSNSGIRPAGYVIPADSPMVSLELRRIGGSSAPISEARPKPRPQPSTPPEEAASKPEKAPAEIQPAPVAVIDNAVDDLTRVKGIGKVTAQQLAALGITRFSQLAAMSEEVLNALDLSVRNRETWIDQARQLASE